MTSDDGAFPVLPMNLLGLGDVLRYLTALSREGHRVYRHPGQENVFYVELNESYRLPNQRVVGAVANPAPLP